MEMHRKTLTLREVEEIDWRIADVLGRGTYEQIVRAFLVEAAGRDAVRDFESMIHACTELGLLDNAQLPTERDTLNRELCEGVIGLGRQPSDVRRDCFEKIVKDLEFVNTQIGDLKARLEIIRSKSSKSDEDKLEERLAQHYLARNIEQKEEIFEFTSSSRAISDYVRVQSGRSVSMFDSILRGPSYYLIERNLRFRVPSPLDNKFGHLPIKEHYALADLFSRDVGEFKDVLSAYIHDDRTIESLRPLIAASLTLSHRKETLEECLGLFESRNFLSFSTVLLVQLEGIFEDICDSLGLKLNEKGQAGLVDKVSAIMDLRKRAEGFFHAEEYYRFFLPYLRNKAAHSKLLPLDADILSGLLLLDLEEIVKITGADWIPVNKKLRALEGAEGAEADERWRNVLILAALNKTTFPRTDLVRREQDAELLLLEDGFWDFVKQLASNDTSSHDGLRQLLTYVKQKSGMKDRAGALYPLLSNRAETPSPIDLLIFVLEHPKVAASS